MNNMTDIQTLWQSQTTNTVADVNDRVKMPDIIEKFKKFEKKQLRINVAKSIAVALIFLQFTVWSYHMAANSIFFSAGVIWILLVMVAFMMLYWKKQFRHKSLNLKLNTVDLLESAIQKLNEQKRLFSRYFPLLAIALLLGLNILYLDLLAEKDLLYRVLFHLGMSVFLMVVFALGLRIRKRKFRKEYQPLIDELETIINDFKK